MTKEIYIPESYETDKIDFSKIDWDAVNKRTISENSDCIDCIHRLDRTCLAFPCGIPNVYISGEKKHRVPDGREWEGTVCEFEMQL
jgi:hypothetical protein